MKIAIYELEENRFIEKENGIWRSSEGILGADDRAGVAVILQMAEDLANSFFNGKVKYVFTVKEECGLIGSSNIDKYFIWGMDATFVVDHRGTQVTFPSHVETIVHFVTLCLELGVPGTSRFMKHLHNPLSPLKFYSGALGKPVRERKLSPFVFSMFLLTQLAYLL